MQKYWAVVEGSGDNFGAFVPDVGGAVGLGNTYEKAVESLSQGLAIQLQDLHERGLEPPQATAREKLDLTEFEPEEPYQLIEIEPAPMNPVSLAIEAELERRGMRPITLAQRAGMPRSVVSRLMNPFYWGHSLKSLNAVAAALDMELEVRFAPVVPAVESASAR